MYSATCQDKDVGIVLSVVSSAMGTGAVQTKTSIECCQKIIVFFQHIFVFSLPDTNMCCDYYISVCSAYLSFYLYHIHIITDNYTT